MRTWTIVMGLMLATSGIASAGMQDPAQGDSKVAAEKAALERTRSDNRQSSHSDRQQMRSGLENMRGSAGPSHSVSSAYQARMGGMSGVHR